MSKKSFLYLGLIVLSALAIAGCASRAKLAPSPMPAAMEIAAEADRGAQEPAAAKSSAVAGLPQERMIVRTVDMELIVHDTAASLESVRGVPAGDLETVLEKLRALGQVESESQSSEEVTDEYVDLQARLKNLELAEQELQELLKTRQETGKTEDILEVYRELTNIRGQIEQIKGRMQYLENMTALATINLTLTPDALAQPVVIGGWQPQGTVRDAVRTLEAAGSGLAYGTVPDRVRLPETHWGATSEKVIPRTRHLPDWRAARCCFGAQTSSQSRN